MKIILKIIFEIIMEIIFKISKCIGRKIPVMREIFVRTICFFTFTNNYNKLSTDKNYILSDREQWKHTYTVY